MFKVIKAALVQPGFRIMKDGALTPPVQKTHLNPTYSWIGFSWGDMVGQWAGWYRLESLILVDIPDCRKAVPGAKDSEQVG